jgi:hypothetical protein
MKSDQTMYPGIKQIIPCTEELYAVLDLTNDDDEEMYIYYDKVVMFALLELDDDGNTEIQPIPKSYLRRVSTIEIEHLISEFRFVISDPKPFEFLTEIATDRNNIHHLARKVKDRVDKARIAAKQKK